MYLLERARVQRFERQILAGPVTPARLGMFLRCCSSRSCSSTLFLLVIMTCIAHDVRRTCSKYVRNARILNLNFDTGYYADDTMLFSAKARALHELIRHAEFFSEQYGLRLNRSECGVIHMQAFSADVPLPKAQKAAYLRDNLNHTVDLRHEVSQRIQDVKRSWLKLHAFWKDTSANRKWQLLIDDAVIRSRLLFHGLETVHLTKSLARQPNAFHHRGLHKILNLDSTYVNRANTNAKLLELATQAAGRQIEPFDQIHIFRSSNSDPLRQVSYKPDSAEPFEVGRRRVGRPRQQRLSEVNSLVYARYIRTTHMVVLIVKTDSFFKKLRIE